jgi:hypothetical protein
MVKVKDLVISHIRSFTFIVTANISNIGTRVLKCVEGQFNKVFILTMDNGDEVVAKIPNPNAGPSFYTLASEVATRHLVSAP